MWRFRFGMWEVVGKEEKRAQGLRPYEDYGVGGGDRKRGMRTHSRAPLHKLDGEGITVKGVSGCKNRTFVLKLRCKKGYFNDDHPPNSTGGSVCRV